MSQAPGVAIVTGAGSGIGRATAVMLAHRAWKLTLVGRRPGALQETAAMLPQGSNPEVFSTDITAAGGTEGMIERTITRFGRLDALVNNAGYAPLLPIERTTRRVLHEVYGINALAPAHAIALAWPIFVRQKSGCIVNLSTMGTLDPFPGFFAYAAAKSAMNSMARSCAKEGAAHNIRAFAVAPGAVETAMLRSIVPESSLPRSACLAPEDVARVITGCIEGDYDDRNGQTITVTAS
ncbi:MAG: SDR family oxidoreductase [Phycisphaerales bacterium]|nr:SDR family oxidoreductase [Phycisphaerales bacterium]